MRKNYSKIVASLLFVSWIFPFHLSANEENGEEVIYEIVGGAIISPPDEDNLIHQGLTGDIQVGLGGVDLNNRSFKFGEYSGIEGDKVFAISDADLTYIYKSSYIDFSVANLGLDNRNIFLEAGDSGNYKFFLEHDQIPHLLSSINKTPFDGAGTDTLTLKSGFNKQIGFLMDPIMVSEDVELKLDDRDTTTIGFYKTLEQNEFRLEFNRIKKNGLISMGGVVGNRTLDPEAIILPAPVDQSVYEVSASIAHHGEKAQMELQYFFSLYNNEKESLTFENPFVRPAGPPPGPPPPPPPPGPPPPPLPDVARISREPDHLMHRVSLTGGVNLSNTTRVSAIAEYSYSRQDETLLPFGVGSSSSLLPRQTADALMQTFHVTLEGHARPLPELNLKAKYRYYQTSNSTPETLFLAIVNDTGMPVPVTRDRAIISLPYEYSQHQINLDTSYRLFRATHLKLGYELDIMDRAFRAVDQTIENKFKVALRSNYFPASSARINFEYSDRSGDPYAQTNVTNFRHTPEFLSSPGTGIIATPEELRRYDVADRNRIKSGLNLSLMPSPTLTLGMGYQFNMDEYEDSGLGLQEITNHDLTFDINYIPDEMSSIYAFYSYNVRQLDQMGRAFDPMIAGSISDPERNFETNLHDHSHTIGIGTKLAFLNNKLTWETEYNFSVSNTNNNFSAGSHPSVSNPSNLPNLETYLHSFTTTGKYKLSKNLSLGLTYMLQSFSSDDFALEEFSPLSVLGGRPIQVILLSDQVQDYLANAAFLFGVYRFGK
ncbi:MAG: MtrB/PioB family decaheme-associated outer membrane protein [Nitrospinales bacterium]